jgi:hypothetical protein
MFSPFLYNDNFLCAIHKTKVVLVVRGYQLVQNIRLIHSCELGWAFSPSKPTQAAVGQAFSLQSQGPAHVVWAFGVTVICFESSSRPKLPDLLGLDAGNGHVHGEQLFDSIHLELLE